MKKNKYDKSLQLLQDFFDSDKGNAYFENLQKILELQLKRYVRFEKWLEHNNFDELMQRLITEHDDNYRDKCYNKGYEPHPNNKLGFVISYVIHNRESIDVPQLNKGFPNQIWFFKGYYIQMVWGQGVFTQVLDDKFNQIIAC
jgi:hypothetical protein